MINAIILTNGVVFNWHDNYTVIGCGYSSTIKISIMQKLLKATLMVVSFALSLFELQAINTNANTMPERSSFFILKRFD